MCTIVVQTGIMVNSVDSENKGHLVQSIVTNGVRGVRMGFPVPTTDETSNNTRVTGCVTSSVSTTNDSYLCTLLTSKVCIRILCQFWYLLKLYERILFLSFIFRIERSSQEHNNSHRSYFSLSSIRPVSLFVHMGRG